MIVFSWEYHVFKRGKLKLFGSGQTASPEFGKLVAGRAVNELGRNLWREKLELWKE